MKPNVHNKLSDDLTIQQLQAYVKEMCERNDWNKDSLETKYLLFSEEVGELAKALRRHKHIYDEEGKKEESLEGEFADVLMYLANLANNTGIDLEKALKDKEKENLSRKWK